MDSKEVAVEPTAVTSPELLGKGRYMIFETPEGGMMLTIRKDGDTEDGHIPLPPHMWRLLRAVIEGRMDPGSMNPAKIFQMMRGVQ